MHSVNVYYLVDKQKVKKETVIVPIAVVLAGLFLIALPVVVNCIRSKQQISGTHGNHAIEIPMGHYEKGKSKAKN